MVRIYLAICFIFFCTRVVDGLHSNARSAESNLKYFVLDPVKYNNHIQTLIQSQEEVGHGNNFRRSVLLGQIIAKLRGIVCGKADLVFGSAGEDARASTILSLDTDDERMAAGSQNYVILFAADECILKSSLANSKSVWVVVRVIPDLNRPIKEVYFDKSCDCTFKRGDLAEGRHHEFKLYCKSAPAATEPFAQEEDCLDLSGADAINEKELMSLPAKFLGKNSEAPRESRVVAAQVSLAPSPCLADQDETLVLKKSLPDLSDYFWKPSSSEFFGEEPDVKSTARAESDESKELLQDASPHGGRKGVKLERELRESCNGREYQLILNTLLIIVDKLIEHLDYK